MSVLRYSHDVDLEPRYRNPNSATNTQQAVEEVPPYPQNVPSPLFYENQLLFGAMPTDQQMINYLGPIWNERLPRVNSNNLNRAQDINTSSAATHLHPDPSHDHSSKMRKTTLKKGSAARKSGKKDRHSKINTAQGVRDRRMRLSLHIARKFFDLQDMLGFDKASKTIDWLFSKSKKAIKQLNCRPNQKGSRGGEKSEQKRKVIIEASEDERESGLKPADKSVTSGSTKSTAKELRDKARARARERTRERMIIRCLEKSNLNFCDEAYNLADLGPAEYLALLNATASSSGSVSSSMYNYDENNGDLFITGDLDSFSKNLCYTGNWETAPEYSNPNSINFHEDPGYHFQYYDHNQVE